MSPSQGQRGNLRLAFIGAGNMATAMIRGLLADGESADNIHVADPVAQALEAMNSLGVTTHTDNNAAVGQADIVILAVKPQVAQRVVSELHLTSAQLLISIAAGINLQSLQNWTDPAQPIVRCMPNTPALLGAGITGLYGNQACTETQRQQATRVLQAAGEIIWVTEEKQLDAVTALSGSGPAYFFLLMEAMVDAGCKLGLSQQVSTQLTLQTAFGAALMAQQSEHTPARLRDNVTSPGGTTAAALEVMLRENLPQTIADAVSAADHRAAELAEEFGR